MLVSLTDLRRRTFGPHPTAQDWRAASKAEIEQALAAEVIRRSPKLYAGYDEDAVKFVRNTMGPTKWDLLLAAEAYGLAPQGTYLYPGERKQPHAMRARQGMPRKLKLLSGTWRYIVDKNGITTLWSPSGQRFRVGGIHTFTSCMCSCPPELQCFGKGFSPGSLRQFIEKHVLGAGPPEISAYEQQRLL